MASELKKPKQSLEAIENKFILQKAKMVFEDLEEIGIVDAREFTGEVVAFYAIFISFAGHIRSSIEATIDEPSGSVQ